MLNCRRLIITSLSLLLVVSLAPSVFGEAAPWPIPTPKSKSHPGAKAAPASSPTTYPDTQGFKERSAAVITALADGGLQKWREGYFRGGDPGKYLPGHAMAKLIINPDDKEARKYMNDDRSYKEHYHFATVNWARYYPIFADRTLSDDTKKKFAEASFRYGSFLSPRGTENHKTMWMTSVNVLPYYTDKGLSHRGKAETLKRGKEMLREYVKGLYMAGQGEWDSSTYLMFDVNGMLNIYDFAEDEETRLLAKAALDWYVAGYALKYRDGVYTAPNQRGYAGSPASTIADNTGYIWWGSNHKPSHDEMRDWRYTVHAITSSWRPSKVIHNIATKNLPELPATFRNSKPNYWYGPGHEPKASVYHETVHLGKHFTMASLWNGHGGQMTRFQIVASTPEGGVVFHGGHPRQSDHTGKKTGVGFKDGIGRYEQSAQVDSTYITMAKTPEDDETAYMFFTLPEGSKPHSVEGWTVTGVGKVAVALRPLGGKFEVAEMRLTGKQQKRNEQAKAEGKPLPYKPKQMLKLEGRKVGFIVEVLENSNGADPASLAKKLDRTKLEVGDFARNMTIKYINVDGRVMTMAYQDGKDRAATSVDGKKVEFGDWPIYGGRYIHHDKGVLTVNDGRDGFVVDFTGKLPVYKGWKKDK